MKPRLIAERGQQCVLVYADGRVATLPFGDCAGLYLHINETCDECGHSKRMRRFQGVGAAADKDSTGKSDAPLVFVEVPT